MTGKEDYTLQWVALGFVLFFFFNFFKKFFLPSGQPPHGSEIASYVTAIYQAWREIAFLFYSYSNRLLPPWGEVYLRSIPNWELTTGGLTSDSIFTHEKQP